MTADERQYWLMRAEQEDAAAINATCTAASQRHAELARLYRGRYMNPLAADAPRLGWTQVGGEELSRLSRSLQVA